MRIPERTVLVATTRFTPRRLLVAVFVGLLLCAPTIGAEPLRVAVSVPPLAWFVSALGGDQVRVVVALPPGSSPAAYDPTPRALARLADCKLLIRIGVPMENVLVPALRRVVPGLVIVDAAVHVAGIPSHHRHDHGGGDHGAAAPDPHVWLSPRRDITILATIATALERARPDLADRIARKQPELAARFTQLDHDLASLLHGARRPVVVHHPAYGYFTADYGLQTLVVERAGLSPTPRYLSRVMEKIAASGATGLVVQPQFASGQVRKAAAALGLEIVVLDPLARDLPTNLKRMAVQLAELGAADGRTQ